MILEKYTEKQGKFCQITEGLFACISMTPYQRHPKEDYQTCNICKQCGKICADYNAMKFHVRQVHCDRTLKCTYDKCDSVFKVGTYSTHLNHGFLVHRF